LPAQDENINRYSKLLGFWSSQALTHPPIKLKYGAFRCANFYLIDCYNNVFHRRNAKKCPIPIADIIYYFLCYCITQSHSYFVLFLNI